MAEQSSELKVFFGALPPQVALGTIVLVGILYGGYYHVPEGVIPLPQSDDFSARMLYTFRCFLFPALFLLVAISLTGRRRAQVGALNPLTGNEAAMELSKKRLNNTLEQTFIYVMFVVFLTTLLEREEMKLVLLSTTLFVVGRIMFWVGYGIHPAYREAGIVVTFGNVGTALVISTYLACSRGFMLSPMISTASAIAAPIGILLPIFAL